MAITKGTVQIGTASGTTTLTVTGLTPTGSNTALFAGVGTSGTNGQLTTSVTFATVTMVEDWDFIASTSFHNSGHHLVAPATSGSLVLTLAALQDEIGLAGLPLAGVDQATPIGTVPANASGSSTTASVTVTSASGELVLANLYSFWNGATPGGGESEEWDQFVVATTTHAGYSEAGAASVVINPTQTAAGGGTQWLINGVSFKPAATATVNTECMAYLPPQRGSHVVNITY